MFKIKHERTADCVVAGYRLHKSGRTPSGHCCSVSTTTKASLPAWALSGRSDGQARSCSPNCSRSSPLRRSSVERPGRKPASAAPREGGEQPLERRKDSPSYRCARERVVEVRYEHMEAPVSGHIAQFARWRPDRDPRSYGLASLRNRFGSISRTSSQAGGLRGGFFPLQPPDHAAGG